jgi:hypothetical protein
MLVPSTAPLPNNTLTPIPQTWVDARNAAIGLFSLRAAQSLAITNCYTPAGGYAESVGPYTAAEVAASQVSSAQAASDLSGATIPSAAGTSPAVAPTSSWLTDTPSIVGPAPIVLPFNAVGLDAPGLPHPSGPTNSCQTRQQTNQRQAQPQMLMPKHFPTLVPGDPIAGGLGDYAPTWGASRGGSSCNGGNGGGIHWGSAVIALAVAFGIMAVLEG